MEKPTGPLVTWGHKPKPNGGRRRPRPVACVYPNSQPPLPRGRPRPAPVSNMRRLGVEPLVVEGAFCVPPKAITGNTQVDMLNKLVCSLYDNVAGLLEQIEENNTPILDDTVPIRTPTKLLEQKVAFARTLAFKLRREVIRMGYKAVNEPKLFQGKGGTGKNSGKA